jgi:hypothetical protein
MRELLTPLVTALPSTILLRVDRMAAIYFRALANGLTNSLTETFPIRASMFG